MAGIKGPFAWKMIILHMSGQDTDTPGGLTKWALENGYDDTPYHFIIDTRGRLFYGRPLTRQGCHGNKTANEHGIGIAMIGNFNEHKPSSAQLRSTARLCALLRIVYNILPSNIYGHKEVRNKPTSCPGDKFPLNKFRDAVMKDYLKIYGACNFGGFPF